jgi:hypothetical protein
MRQLHKVAARGLVAALSAALLVTGLTGTVFAAASATPVTTTVVANGTATPMPLAPVTIGAPADITAGVLTITLPAGFSWAASGTILTVETGGTLVVSDAVITLGGNSAAFAASGTVIAGNTLAFSTPTVKTTTSGANGDVVLSGTLTPASLVVARLKTPGDHDDHDGRDADRGMGHGARKVGFFDNPAWTCATGAQPVTGAPTFGFAILNTTGKRMLNVNVVLKGALPNATYDVWVSQDPGACSPTTPTKAGAVHTNALGNGTGHLKMGVVSGAQHFWVSATSGATVLRTRAAVLRIKGK